MMNNKDERIEKEHLEQGIKELNQEIYAANFHFYKEIEAFDFYMDHQSTCKCHELSYVTSYYSFINLCGDKDRILEKKYYSERLAFAIIEKSSLLRGKYTFYWQVPVDKFQGLVTLKTILINQEPKDEFDFEEHFKNLKSRNEKRGD